MSAAARGAASAAASEVRAVVDAIAALTERVAGGATGAEIDGWVARAQAAAETATDAERGDLVDALAGLEQAVAGSLDRLGAELRRAGERRRALAGFRSVRAWTTAQNLRTRV